MMRHDMSDHPSVVAAVLLMLIVMAGLPYLQSQLNRATEESR